MPGKQMSQAGNVFFALFGAVGLVGVVGASSMMIMKGPVAGMQKVTKYTVAENAMIAAGRLSLVAAITQTDNGDCDADNFIEPVPWATGTGTPPAGGGFIPATIGASRQDPWGSTYGYCVWDHGTQIKAGGCGGAGANRLRGSADGNEAKNKAVIAIISAGPDRVFQTTCANHPDYLEKPGTSDDLVLSYTYGEAGTLSGGLWNLKEGKPDTAEIAKNLEVKNSGGNVVFGVDSTTDAARPSIKVDYIQKLSAARKGVEFISNIILNNVWLSGDGDAEGIRIDASGNVGVGAVPSGYKLDVNGTARINSTFDVTQPVGSTGNRMVRVGYEDNSNYFRILSYGSAHATLPGRLLMDNIVGGSSSTGGYIDFQPGANYTRLYASGGATGTLQFFTGGTESMRILADGKTGIGIAAPTQRLHVAGGNALVGGEVISTGASSNQFRAIGGSYGTFIRNDGSNVYWLLTDSGNQYGTYNALRPFAFNVTTGNVTMAHAVTVGGALAANGGVAVDGKTVIHGTNGQIHSAYYGDDTRYGYFEGRTASGTRGFYFGYGNGGTTVNLQLENSATILNFNGPAGSYIQMNSKKITGLAAPTADTDAATKAYVDANSISQADGDARYLRLTGGTLTGTLTMGGTATINMGSSKITSLATPTAAADAATKNYVDTQVSASVGSLNASNLSSGTVAAARLGSSGSRNTQTFLRGDNTWSNRVVNSGGLAGITIAGTGDGTNTATFSLAEYATSEANSGAWKRWMLTHRGAANDFMLQYYNGSAWYSALTVYADKRGITQHAGNFQVSSGYARARAFFMRSGEDSVGENLSDLYNLTVGDDLIIGTVGGGNDAGGGNNHKKVFMNADHNHSSPDDDIHFVNYGTSGAQTAFVIKGNGRVGIGIENPTHALHVEGSSGGYMAHIENIATSEQPDGLTIKLVGNADNLPTGSGYIRFLNRADTQVGRIHANGSGGVTYTTTSDRRIKRNIVDTRFGLDDLMRIKVRDYNPLDNDKLVTGYVAQELYEVFPDAVSKGETEEDIWGVDYGRVTPLIIKAVQEQTKQIEELTKRIRALEADNDNLRAELRAGTIHDANGR